MKRPWVVFVRDIGPTFTFASEANARQRACDLTAAEYAEVHVWTHEIHADDPHLLRRSIYRDGQLHHDQVFPHGGHAWQDVPTTTTQGATS